jgi:hypothetical protein
MARALEIVDPHHHLGIALGTCTCSTGLLR